MAYDPSKDFVGLWRNAAGAASKLEMPGLDYVVAAMARAGLIAVAVSATPPVVNQPTTAWLRTAVPSYSAEGALYLWDAVAASYVAATPALFLRLLEASVGENGSSLRTTTGGPPANTVGLDGDFAVRLDAPNGIYGPKAGGVWPASPVPGTADVLTSVSLDNTFGTTRGSFIARGATVWQAFALGATNTLLTSDGVDPAWSGLSALMDTVFGSAQGSLLFRDAGSWNDFPPGVAGQILATGGAGAPPAWVARTAEFPSGTVMLFQQSAAPPGWTKQTLINDVGLRVVSGTVGSVNATPFSTVFAQTRVGGTAISVAQMPAHHHDVTFVGTGGALTLQSNGDSAYNNFTRSTTDVGGGQSHDHGINLTLSYVDVIIASKN